MENIELLTLYEDDVITFEYGREAAVLKIAFRVSPSTDQFRNGYRLAIDTARQKEVRRWFTDARQIKGMLTENQACLKQHMGSLFSTSGLCKMGIVMAPECFVMTNPNKVYEKPAPDAGAATGAGPIKVFFDLDAAYAWLLEE